VCLLNIGLLRALVTAAKQDHYRLPALAVIHPVAGAIINPHLRYSAGQMAAVARISHRQPAHPRLYPSLRLPVTQRIKPGIKHGGGADFENVSIILDILARVNPLGVCYRRQSMLQCSASQQ